MINISNLMLLNYKIWRLSWKWIVNIVWLKCNTLHEIPRCQLWLPDISLTREHTNESSIISFINRAKNDSHLIDLHLTRIILVSLFITYADSHFTEWITESLIIGFLLDMQDSFRFYVRDFVSVSMTLHYITNRLWHKFS